MVLQGIASFVDKNTVKVGSTMISSDYIMISTGSYPVHPENIPFDFKRDEAVGYRPVFISNKDLFEKMPYDEKNKIDSTFNAWEYYFEKLNKKRKAHAILDEAIEADGVVDFQDFFCIFDKIHFYTLDKNKAGLKRELERVKEISSKKISCNYCMHHASCQLFFAFESCFKLVNLY